MKIEFLRCPNCLSAIQRNFSEEFFCNNCNKIFPNRNGKLVLLSDKNELLSIADYPEESVEKNVIVRSNSGSRSAEKNPVDSQSSTKETNIKRQLNPLDPFQDRWKTVNLGGKTTFHVYSAFALKSKDNQGYYDQVRITAAIPSVYVVSKILCFSKSFCVGESSSMNSI